MPRYHFHLVNGHQLSDTSGIELPSDDAARAHALDIADTWTAPYRAVRVVSDDGREFRVPIACDERSK